MNDLKKTVNLPEQYDPVHMTNVLHNVIDGTQGKYLSPVTSLPGATEGANGEMRVDHTNQKVYIKIAGNWMTFTGA